MDLLGVVLFGVDRVARRISDTAPAAIAKDLGSTDALFTTAIRHAEATAPETLDRGLLADELEEAVLAAPRWYERLRGAAAGQPAGGGEGPRSRSATGPAEDLQALGEEIIARISAHEAADEAARSSRPVPGAPDEPQNPAGTPRSRRTAAALHPTRSRRGTRLSGPTATLAPAPLPTTLSA